LGSVGFHLQAQTGSSESSGAQANLYLNLMTDCYPEENDWILTDADNTVLFDGGPYFGEPLTEITEYIWLENGSYTFTFYDAAGDGMYATQWNGTCGENGTFELVDAGGNVLLSYDGTSDFDSLTVTFDFDSSVGIEEPAAFQTVTFSPNPFTSQIQLRIDMQKAGMLKAEVYSLEGKKVYHEALGNFSAGYNIALLNLSQLQAGMYSIRLFNDQHSTTTSLLKIR